MTAEIIAIDPNAPNPDSIKRAAGALAEGALVAFPTETVYGLAASAANQNSVEKLRELKGRESTQPFTVHIGRSEDCETFVPEISNLGRRFMRKGWPGPLTLVFTVENPSTATIHTRLSDAGREAIYSRGSVGVRHPDHRAAEAFLSAAGVPVIASSANRTGLAPPIEAHEIAESLGNEIDLVIDSGVTRYRKGSTIVALNGSGYKLLREGVWDERTVRRLSTVNILFVCTGNTCRSPIAEGLCRKLLAQRLDCRMDELSARGISVMSAGTSAYGGGRASPESVEVVSRRGGDISGHVSQPLTTELIRTADYIFAMTRTHLDAVAYLAPFAASKVSTLLENDDIADPVGGPVEDYERVATQIEAALATRLNEVQL